MSNTVRCSHSESRSVIRSQQGALLLVLVLTMLMVTGTGLAAGYVVMQKKTASHREIGRSLALAKEALIGYAVTYADNYGHNTRGGVGRLPCPATEPHGSPEWRCGTNAIGYLPSVWTRDGKQLDIDHREYFLNQNLWYAVASSFRFNPAFNHLNPATDDGYLQINDRQDIVAIIIHPGPGTENQFRTALDADVSNFLETENADGDNSFSVGLDSNDRLLAISRTELMPLVERRVLGFVKDWLLEYYAENGHFPYAAPLGDPDGACQEGLLTGAIAMTRGNCSKPSLGELVSVSVPKSRPLSKTWFGAYNWSMFVYYRLDESCASAGQVSICESPDSSVKLLVDELPAKAVLVATGGEIVSEHLGAIQNRELFPEDPTSYLDTGSMLDADWHYSLDEIRVSKFSNDQMLVIR